MKQISNEELMQQVATGKLHQLTVLFDRFHIRIFNFFNQMTQNKMVSEDLTQDVFEKLIKYRSSYKKGNFTSYIFTIARNIFSDHYQKQKKERTENIQEETLNYKTDKNHTEEIQHLKKALLQLSNTEKELITMHRYQNISYQQIAEIIGSTEGAIKVRTHRALKKLKEIYFTK